MANIELARETMRQLETGELEPAAREEDPLRLLRAREEAGAGAASNRATNPQPATSPPPPRPPRAASVDVGSSREDAAGLGGSELQISQLLLDALASKPLSGDARARAAGALAAGIARNDENALKAALAILVTGE